MQIADRIGRLGTEQAFGVLARAKEMERKGIDMVHMEIGDLDFDTPEPIKAAGLKALAENKTHYLPSQGLFELREVLAAHIAKTRGIAVGPEQVVVTPGGKPTIFYTILATVNPGDEVILPSPGFPAYESVVNFVGGKSVLLPILAEREFNFDPAELERLVTPKTRLIIINSPHNPTGGILTHESLEHVARIAKQHDLWVLSDEVYDRLIYEGRFESVASLPGMAERTIILNAYTKSFSMSGWRLGYGVMPAPLAAIEANLINNSVSCTPNFTQWAGIEGFSRATDEAVNRMCTELKERRDLLTKAVNELPGVRCHVPRGTIYLFPDIRGTGKTSQEIYELLFSEAHVATLPGTSFGVHGEGFIRLSFGPTPRERIAEAITRIRKVWPAGS